MNIQNKNLIGLMVAALGVVYGDIGTSPLYALKSCFSLTNLPVTENNVLGIISIFIWFLIIIVNIKYIFLVMRCQQQGEGGILVLSSLLSKAKNKNIRQITFFLGIIAIALFVGDSAITPAISVLSALEGLNLVIELPDNFIMITSILILMLLFFLQKKGSAVIGKYFGYVMVIWFLVLAILGVIEIFKYPKIIWALNPYYAIKFLWENGPSAWASLGGAILVITGVEALYADMGHFGYSAIKNSWKYFVFPALTLNYLGQGSLLISMPAALENPFYFLVSKEFIYPLTLLSVIATIIASQAVISGLFSLSWQAIMLNYFPRLRVVHTSLNQRGQIYLPSINNILCVLSIVAIIIFRDSDSLASAYGLSVASVMLISSIFVSLLSYYEWRWSLIKTISVFIPLLILDIIFVTTNLEKIVQGAWYAILIAAFITYLILTWIKGNKILRQFKGQEREGLNEFLLNYSKKFKTKIPGCAIFMSRDLNYVPFALEVQLQHNKFLHHKMLFVTVSTEEAPIVPTEEKFSYIDNNIRISNIFCIKAKFGFYERPNFMRFIEWARSENILVDNEDVSFFLGRSMPVADKNIRIRWFSESLYIFLVKNSVPAYEFFNIDYNQVIELGFRFKV